MKTKLIQFVSLFLLLLVSGVFWGTWFTLTRSIEHFSAAEFIHIGKIIIANVAVPMRILMPSCILFMFLSLLFYPQKKSTGFYLNLTALVLIIITLLITLLILVPIDNQIKHWTVAEIPSDWESIRSKWQLFHSVRTFTSLASFACFTLSVLK
ncbi:DUF1772 domain-containing protein [Chitinophagaceae bacterium LB-8]|uniref:DUF1772 domain-containing protein n=1 Tax=Paraflavisolibacter caeni TaxID=2982496 RepID=A0A9X2XTT5_9BACT|nr:anthrone oxygenase family protein [Paraflavisolibacter caeni]MCU7547548.1 DUF1772 domain-containing protein [Paraflavisolibacter caeni]